MPVIDIIAGARPNFMKIAPIIDAIRACRNDNGSLRYRLIHTGQHYDRNMSGSFFEQLGIPDPDVNFGVGGGSQAEQTAGIMVAYENLLSQSLSDLCLVVGDVTSTMACAIAAKKAGVKVAHVEAGIRSGDMSMPEEINRIVTDSLTDYFFTTSETANENLRILGVPDENVHFVGNTMIDTLLKHRSRFIQPPCWQDCHLEENKFMVLTLHRPSNVDEEHQLGDLLKSIVDYSRGLPLIFPVHPRTKKIIESMHLNMENLVMIEPLSYLEFNYLVSKSFAVITDSGGITEEATVMGIPCLTLRDTTERPETVTLGTNELVGSDPKNVPLALDKLFSGSWKEHTIPPMWDGNTGARIVDILSSKLLA